MATVESKSILPIDSSAVRLTERSIGALLIDAGKLTAGDAERVLRAQKEKGLRFGEAAVKLGLVKEEDIQQVLSSQFDYPYVHSDSSILSEVVAAYQPFSKQVEQLRALRSQLLLRWFSESTKVLTVVSPQRKEGRTYVTANLAVVFSQLGERTLLIDADLRSPKQHKLFGVDDKTGLSMVLAGRTGHGAVKRVSGLVDLSVLPAGPPPPNPQELLVRGGFAALLESLQGAFDIVLIDTPAAELSADFQAIAAVGKGALVIGRRDVTPARSVRGLNQALLDLGVRVVGAVLNDF